MSDVSASVTISPPAWASGDDEVDLVQRAKHDRTAFAEFYRRHYRPLCAYVFRRTGDVHATEDLVSDVFLAALRMLSRYRPRGVPVRYWLLRIATNSVNRWARRRRNRSAATLESDPPADTRVATVGGEDAERALRALLTLSPKFQAVLSLFYFEELSVKDVAAILGCREGTVKSRLARARDALRAALNGRR